jgi:hypothetical protein
MTKTVRIENADTSNHKLLAFCEELEQNGQWVCQPNTMTRLDLPTTMTTLTVWTGRRIVIQEVKE